eukprot:scaffold97812_cov63-Phaeocystis_antarctica.AAC.1
MARAKVQCPVSAMCQMIGHVCAKSSLRRVPHSAVQSAVVAYPLDDVHFLGVLLQGSIAGTRVDDGRFW